ncbi:ABC transporter substrate-binding protein [Brucellaceae bacterium C25G]
MFNFDQKRTTLLSGIATLILSLQLAVSPASAAEKELVIGLEADPVCLDGRQINYLWSLDIYHQVVDSLTDQDPVTGEILPWLADRWTVNSDATEFVFHIRNGVTFSDGDVLDAEAVVKNFDDLAKQTYSAPYLKGLSNVEALDPETVKFTFTSPNAQFLFSTSSTQLGMLSPKTLADVNPADRCLGKISGTGPYVYDENVPQRQVTLKARQDYAWPSPVSSNKGPAHIDRLVFEIIPEASVRNGSLLSGVIHIDHFVQEQDQKPLQDSGFKVLDVPGRGLVHSILPNHQSPVWGDARVRQALNLAIDRAALTAILPSGSKPASSILTSAAPGYTDFTQLLQTDIEKANSLLDESGWLPGGDGVRVKDGKPLTLKVLLRKNPLRQSVLEVVQQQVAPLGIKLVISVQDHASATEAERLGNYDAVNWNLTRNDVSALFNYLDPAGSNPLKLVDDGSELFQLQKTLRSTTDKNEQQRIADRLVTLALDNADVVPLFENAVNIGIAPEIQNLALDATNRLNLQQVDFE